MLERRVWAAVCFSPDLVERTQIFCFLELKGSLVEQQQENADMSWTERRFFYQRESVC